MSQLNCPQLKRTIEINCQESLMQNLLAHNIPVASSCGGEGICGKCKMRIFPQKELKPPAELEKTTLEKNNAASDERLSCQVHLKENARVETNYW